MGQDFPYSLNTQEREIGISCSIVLDLNVMLRSNRAGLARHNWQKEQWEIFFSSEVTRCRNSPL
jgi:hypothetical protein